MGCGEEQAVGSESPLAIRPHAGEVYGLRRYASGGIAGFFSQGE